MPTDFYAVPEITGVEHWVAKGSVKLFLWEKFVGDRRSARDAIVLVHGSSLPGRPTFDLDVPGRANSSIMERFARLGYDTWCLDMEGYGRSDKHRDVTCDVANGADDLAAAATYIAGLRGTHPLLVYGSSSGALRAGLFAQLYPERVAKLALDALVWTGEGSPTLAERRLRLPELLASNRRPISRASIAGIFSRDHPGVADDDVVDALAAAVLEHDDSVPTGTYVDMCSKLPILDPSRIVAPTLIMRGEYDGIATMSDLLGFFDLLPTLDKQFVVMPGVAHASFHEKNVDLAFHVLASFFATPRDPVRSGEKPTPPS